MFRHYNDARTARDLDSRAKILSPVHEGARGVAAQRNRARAAPNGASPSESRARRGCYTDRWDMLLAREFIGYLSRQLVERLTPSTFETSNPPAVAETISEIIGDDLSIEDRLNDEVRDLLDEYSEYMRREGVSYQEMFRRIKNQLVGPTEDHSRIRPRHGRSDEIVARQGKRAFAQDCYRPAEIARCAGS